MRILAIVPARAGSKRLPKKNTRVLGGRPLISWTVAPAMMSGAFVDVLVSTDDEHAAGISTKLGATVLGLRPPHLSGDEASSVDVALFELERYEHAVGKVDAVALLQPTSPFRTVDSIRSAVSMFEATGGAKSVAGFVRTRTHVEWSFKIHNGKIEPIFGWERFRLPPQHGGPTFTLSGSVYLISGAALREKRRFIDEDTKPYFVPDELEGIDIDTALDWSFAEAAILAFGDGNRLGAESCDLSVPQGT